MDDRPLYVLCDGDRTRERLEAPILAGDAEALTVASSRITAAIHAMKAYALANLAGARVVVAAGDDFVFVVPATSYARSHLDALARIYREHTAASVSFGVAHGLDRAYLALRRAKSAGGGRIEEALEPT
ncbi:MAG TPA: mCpol domain-containing protein [Planctomycetota bacterium]|nr:mCpol domain-containing protein [Planctomycetota bacterium]